MGAPRLNVLLGEVGLKEVSSCGVGGPTRKGARVKAQARGAQPTRSVGVGSAGRHRT
jgi:hypothetical protein